MTMAKNGKNAWALFLFLLAGIVLGGCLGYLTKDIPYLSWLNYGQEFGIGDSKGMNLLKVNFGIITVTFGMTIKISIASIIGILIGIFAYRKL